MVFLFNHRERDVRLSNWPQLLTDMQNGGVAYYLVKENKQWLLDGRYPCWYASARIRVDLTSCLCITRVFDSVDSMWAFATAFLQAFNPREGTGESCLTFDEIAVENVVVPKFSLSADIMGLNAAEMLKNFICDQEDRRGMREVLDSREDDYIDDQYTQTPPSYFN